MLLQTDDTGERDRPILFFVHGWPDTGALWAQQVAHFSGRYRCVSVTLPGFAPTAAADRRAGREPDIPQLVQALHDTITAVRQGSSAPVILVGHDWGAYLAYLLDMYDPNLASKLITFDVGGHVRARGPAHVLFIATYQGWLVAAYLAGRIVPALGNLMTRAFAVVARAPQPGSAGASANYLYYHAWRAAFTRRTWLPVHSAFRITKPLLYLYGTRKPFHFHSQQWLADVEASPGSRAVGVDADHWLMIRTPGEVNALMDEWLTPHHS